jgi:hypothetical protein
VIGKWLDLDLGGADFGAIRPDAPDVEWIEKPSQWHRQRGHKHKTCRNPCQLSLEPIVKASGPMSVCMGLSQALVDSGWPDSAAPATEIALHTSIDASNRESN